MTPTIQKNARIALFRALEAERSLTRQHYLYRAAEAFDAAGCPRWAAVARDAAGRIGGGDSDVRDLLDEVERACERRERAA